MGNVLETFGDVSWCEVVRCGAADFESWCVGCSGTLQ